MPRVDVPPAPRGLARRTSSLAVASLAAGLAVGLAAAPSLATAAPTTARPTAAVTDATLPGRGPAGDSSNPPAEPTATEPLPTVAPPTLSPDPTTPAPKPTTAAPTTTAPGKPAPTTTAPTPSRGGTVKSAPPAAPRPGARAGERLGVRITTQDISLDPAYWNAESTETGLRVTVENTGAVTEQVRLAYTLPTGVSDAGTPGCAAAGGGSWRCGEWTAPPGSRFTSVIKVRVDGDAWRGMPLSGTVRVTAGATGTTGVAEDNEGFAVLFPPGPPVPGILLEADEVAFDISGGETELAVRLGNTGRVDAAGRVEVVLPAGVSVPSPPAGCTVDSLSRTRCDLGLLPAGRTEILRLPVVATAEAQREAPLAGALIGVLDPRSGRTREIRTSFKITAAAALATPVATPTPTGSQGVLPAASGGRAGGGSVQRVAVTLISISVLLVAVALAWATTSLRRRMNDPAPQSAGSPAVD
ncbi:hypothetical protein [Micromonospora sp. KC723]|uniref:hypothetical protein n=1 Tax=Micromonospora sp. KC723 TaxID=2530381 RepID=UPI0010476F3A|nr:hypothetical protein [Micromonospora sp. KC723]TDB77547.1 hypothetical protein E1165_03415 [Micromonospora sp. KC723]